MIRYIRSFFTTKRYLQKEQAANIIKSKYREYSETRKQEKKKLKESIEKRFIGINEMEETNEREIIEEEMIYNETERKRIKGNSEKYDNI